MKIAIAFAVSQLVLGSSSLAALCGGGNFEPEPTPPPAAPERVSLSFEGDLAILKYQGEYAAELYHYLDHPSNAIDVLASDTGDEIITKAGNGISCQSINAEDYVCVQELDFLGLDQQGLDRPVVASASSRRLLEFDGIAAQDLFHHLSGIIDQQEINGELYEVRQGVRISCRAPLRDEILVEDASSYQCSQWIIPSGYAWDPNTDPIIVIEN